jgi:hypothetical protein
MTQPTTDSFGKKLLREFLFFLTVILAVILTVVDAFFGIVRYLYGRIIKHRPNFNPWEQTANVWRMIWKHILYLFKMLGPEFREQMKTQRIAMHNAVRTTRDSVRGTVGDDFDYVDAAYFFAMLPYLIVNSIFLTQAAVATFIVFSTLGVIHYHQNTASFPAHPQAETHVADQQEADFGPWHNRGEVIDQVTDPKFKNIAFISDTGAVRYSVAKVASLTGFAQLDFNERVVNPQVLPNGQIHFLDQLGNEYSINAFQAFLFEGYMSKMFIFDASGKLFGIDPTKAQLQ